MAPIFDYKALTPDGKTTKGIVEADTSKNARLKLRKQNLTVTEIQEKTVAKGSSKSASVPFMSGRFGIKEISLVTRQLASLVKANIPLVEALSALVEQTESAKLKVIFSQVRQDVNEGSSLGKALAQHPKAFDHIYINMVEAGESSGTLGLVLQRLADLKEAQMRLRSKIISGMTYPVLMMLVGLGLMIAIFAFVIPKLVTIAQSMNKAMPLSTEILIWISDFLAEWWHLLGIAGFFALWMFGVYTRKGPGKKRWDSFKLRLPIFGDLFRLIAVTRFSGTMSTLLASGVPILTSMAIAKNLIGNVLIEEAVEEARENITEGQSIAEPLRRSGQFPPMVIHMIAIGERTGELPEMLKNVAETFEEQVNTRIEGMTSLVEPAMIIVMGAVVAYVVMAVMLPLLDLSNIQT